MKRNAYQLQLIPATKSVNAKLPKDVQERLSGFLAEQLYEYWRMVTKERTEEDNESGDIS